MPQGIVDATTGLGDAFLVPELVREAFEIDGGVNQCSASYQAGRLTGFAVGAAPFSMAARLWDVSAKLLREWLA